MKRILLSLLFICIAVFGGFLYYQHALTPVNPFHKTPQEFVIPQGAGLKTIGNSLQTQGLIRNSFAFYIYVKLSGLDNKIQAGDFRLQQNMSVQQITNTLTHGTLDIWVTIPEGLRAEEIAAILQKKLPTYDASWLSQLKQHEGYLFPDTYLFPKDASIQNVISIMTNNFNTKYAEATAQKTVKLSQEEVVILASIVQREAITPGDMRLVASTLENRFSIGMALGSDVTVEYVLGYQPAEHTWWKKDLTAYDLQVDSPYNTRLNAGLPPSPICNPGLTALEAVLNPPDTNYIYYVSDKNGKLHFAVTLEQHNINVAKYQ